MAHRHDPPPVGAGHALSQLASISALLRVGASAPFKSKASEEAIEGIRTPGELVEVELAAVPQSILEEYARWTGTSAGADGGDHVPAHLFPQWTVLRPPLSSPNAPTLRVRSFHP